MSQLSVVDCVRVDCDDSVKTVQGLRNKFEQLMISSVNKTDKNGVLLRIPPPVPLRLRELPPVPPRNLPVAQKPELITLPAPPSGSEDSFDSSDDEQPMYLPPVPPRNLPSIPSIPTTFHPQSSDSEDSFDSLDAQETPQYSPKLLNIIQELIEKEESYVECLEIGMLNYMTALDTHDLPLSLRGQKYRIFGNIQNLYDFHKNIFLPQLIKSSQNIEQLADLFTSYIQRDSFYGYVLYALNRRKSELLCDEHVYFFRLIQNACGDKLGINNFLLRPIQQLPKYKLLINEIIKELSCDVDLNKHEIAVSCVAETTILRMLDMVNESMNINNIKNCNEIDIMKQGKFKKLSECLIYDWEQRRRYKGKLLYFERCVIYCEVKNSKGLEFRGYYLKELLGISYVEGKGKFKLYEGKRGKKEIIITGDLSFIQENVGFINSMLMELRTQVKQKSTLKRSQSSRSIENIRNSIMSISSGLSNFSFQSSSSSGTGSYDLKERF